MIKISAARFRLELLAFQPILTIIFNLIYVSGSNTIPTSDEQE
jgi:hypothetical protein